VSGFGDFYWPIFYSKIERLSDIKNAV